MKTCLNYLLFGIFLSFCHLGVGQTLKIYTQQDLILLGQKPVEYSHVIITTYAGQDSATMVTDLSPLGQMDSIYHALYIENTALTSLKGMKGLQFARSVTIRDNLLLEDGASLGGPEKTISFIIENNPKLTSLTNFNWVKNVSGIGVYDNASLEKVAISVDSCAGPFDSTSTIEFGIGVSGNNMLNHVSINDPNKVLDRLSFSFNNSLQSVTLLDSRDSLGNVSFKFCPKINEITGFSKVRFCHAILIHDNSILSELCFVKKILERDGTNALILHDNATGANSETEVLNTDCSDFNTSISELELDDIPLYPNPTSNKLFIDVKKETAYTIYSSSGSLMKSGTLAVGSSIDVSALSSGLYLISMENKRGRFIKK